MIKINLVREDTRGASYSVPRRSPNLAVPALAVVLAIAGIGGFGLYRAQHRSQQLQETEEAVAYEPVQEQAASSLSPTLDAEVEKYLDRNRNGVIMDEEVSASLQEMGYARPIYAGARIKIGSVPEIEPDGSYVIVPQSIAQKWVDDKKSAELYGATSMSQ
jgi:hypothetical protein